MQKFQQGDYVRVAKDLGSSMSHFTSDTDAIVEYSYKDKYGGSDDESYSLFLKDRGSCAWYYGSQLSLIEKDRKDLLKEWEDTKNAEIELKSDIDWIFSHGKEVIESPHGSSIQRLADCFGLTNLWGSRGEGVTYYSNAIATMKMAFPYLESGDKVGWIDHCNKLKQQ